VDPFLQDVIVTVIASLAALLLLQRMRGMIFPARRTPSCEGCPKCEAQERNDVTSVVRS
jgi:hypothetical protein